MSHCFCAVFVYSLCKGDLEHASRRPGSHDELRHQTEEETDCHKEEEIALNGNVDSMEPLESDEEPEIHI
jgi:hypothetical protein